MKYVIVVLDGIADGPIAALEGRTPLEAARTPAIDSLADRGRIGTVATVVPDLPPAAELAAASVLGYDPRKHPMSYAALEAAGLQLPHAAGKAWLCGNFVTLNEEVLADHSAGGIHAREAQALIDALNDHVAAPEVRFLAGSGYRFRVLCPAEWLTDVETTPADAIIGEPIAPYWPRRGAGKGKPEPHLDAILKQAHELLAQHEINRIRTDLGENSANMIWLWGNGPFPDLAPFAEAYGLAGTAVSDDAMVAGLARAIGWHPTLIAAESAEQQLQSLAATARRMLDDKDLVFVYTGIITVPSLAGNVRRKIEAIQTADRLLVAPLAELLTQNADLRLLLLPARAVSCEHVSPVADPVPFLQAGAGTTAIRSLRYAESAARHADLHISEGYQLMAHFLRV